MKQAPPSLINFARQFFKFALVHFRFDVHESLEQMAGQCCENYFQTQKVAGDSFSGGDLKERSDKLRLPLCIITA
jgi:hypothetical protein